MWKIWFIKCINFSLYHDKYFLPLRIIFHYFKGHKHVAVNPNRRSTLGHFRIGTLPSGSIRRNTCGSGFNCIWDKFIFRIHPNPSNPWNPNPLNPLNSNPLSPINPNPLNPNPFNHGFRVDNSNAGIELDEIVLEWGTC